MTRARAPALAAPALVLRDGLWSKHERAVPEETAIAFVVDGGAEAVMMASPSDLEDFAYGFALTEGLIASPSEIRELEIAEVDLGVEVRLWLTDGARSAHAQRRRRRAGPVGCGLCGIESLAEAMRPITAINSEFCIDAEEILAAMAAMAALQNLYQQTRAVHAAAFYTPAEGIVALREDVGRHNALDKLVGALTRASRDAKNGIVLMTSRVSIELIQKAAHIGAPVLAAVSAPTALALRAAEAAGICVCGIVRGDGLEAFTRADRIIREAPSDAD